MNISISVVIPSDDMLISRELYLYGGETPLKNDNSLWMSVVYDLWGVSETILHIKEQIGNLDTDTENIENIISNIKEGIKIVKEKMPYSIHNHVLEIDLEYKLNFIKEKNIVIQEKKHLLIKQINKLIESNDIKDINEEKKQINRKTLEIKNMGANRECLRSIGAKIKQLLDLKSDYIYIRL